MGDLETLGKRAQVYDAAVGQWRTDALTGAIEVIGILVEEWSVLTPTGQPAPLSPDGLRSLDAKTGMRVVRALNAHVEAQGLTAEDLGAESSG